MAPLIFPDWTNRMRLPAGLLLAAAPLYLIGVVYYGGSPKTTDVGYQPEQPIPYSHALHVGQLGMDCRYCHTTVQKASFAAVPTSATCLGCHEKLVKSNSALLTPLRESGATDKPIEWTKVHDLPDFAYFNHAAHTTRGIGCASCHDRVDKMGDKGVHQAKTLSMAWCLDCHRAPENHLRPQDKITDMQYGHGMSAAEQLAEGNRIKKERGINPSTSCSTCHR